MIPPVPMVRACLAFFFDIRDFATRGHFAVPADDASARKGLETQEPNQTHHESPLSIDAQQISYRRGPARDADPLRDIGRTRHGYSRFIAIYLTAADVKTHKKPDQICTVGYYLV